MNAAFSIRRRDRGESLVSILVGVVVASILIVASFMVVTTVFRSEGPNNDRVSEARNIQNVTNWLPSDVMSLGTTSINTSPSAVPPCAAGNPAVEGVSVMLLNPTEVSASDYVNYRLVPEGSSSNLVRISCKSGEAWLKKVNLASDLPLFSQSYSSQNSNASPVKLLSVNETVSLQLFEANGEATIIRATRAGTTAIPSFPPPPPAPTSTVAPSTTTTVAATTTTTAPVVIGAFTLDPGTQGTYFNQVNFCWSHAANATLYDFYRDGVLISSNIPATGSPICVNNTVVTPGVTSTFHVIAKAPAPAAPVTSNSRTYLATAPTLPRPTLSNYYQFVQPVPTPWLNAFPGTVDSYHGNLTISWPATPAVAGYRVFCSGAACPWATQDIMAPATSVNITGIPRDTVIDFRIAPIGAASYVGTQSAGRRLTTGWEWQNKVIVERIATCVNPGVNGTTGGIHIRMWNTGCDSWGVAVAPGEFGMYWKINPARGTWCTSCSTRSFVKYGRDVFSVNGSSLAGMAMPDWTPFGMPATQNAISLGLTKQQIWPSQTSPLCDWVRTSYADINSGSYNTCYWEGSSAVPSYRSVTYSTTTSTGVVRASWAFVLPIYTTIWSGYRMLDGTNTEVTSKYPLYGTYYTSSSTSGRWDPSGSAPNLPMTGEMVMGVTTHRQSVVTDIP